MCDSGCQDYRQHRAGHGAAPLHVCSDRGPVVQGQVLDVLGQVSGGGGDLPGGVLCVQGRADERGHCGGSKAVDQERVQL